VWTIFGSVRIDASWTKPKKVTANLS
jgi:hypothetical protein